jgi:pimeloyl-ACP methyl ester carboxylesterase
MTLPYGDTPEAIVRRQELYRLLGDLPERDRPITVSLIDQMERDGYILERLLLDLNGVEPVPAYFARAPGRQERRPTLLFNHSHGGRYEVGKVELTDGAPYLQPPPYARALTERGWNAFCIDAWNFGERRGRTESELFKEMLWRGRVLWGMMVYDSLRAVDYLCARSDVDTRRIGTLGLSMGSTMAWWLAALDTRIKVCVDLCCLTDFDELIRVRGLDGHGVYYYVPRLLKHFTTSQINALIAPRPHLGLAGNCDPLTPPAGLDRIDRDLSEVYAACGAAEAWRLIRYETGHFESVAGRAEVIAWLERWL